MGDWIAIPSGYLNLDNLISVKIGSSQVVTINGEMCPVDAPDRGQLGAEILMRVRKAEILMRVRKAKSA
jgi:hypothetical protein